MEVRKLLSFCVCLQLIVCTLVLQQPVLNIMKACTTCYAMLNTFFNKFRRISHREVQAYNRLTNLGFMLHPKEVRPHILEFLAFSLYTPPGKVSKIKKVSASAQQIRTLAQIIRLLSLVTPAVHQAPLHYQGLQCPRSRALLHKPRLRPHSAPQPGGVSGLSVVD